MNSNDFKRALITLYNTSWQSDFASDYACHRTTVARWGNGKFKIPQDAVDFLSARIDYQIKSLKMVRTLLK